MNTKDYYQILGVAKSADGRAIKQAYRNLALQYHPDRNRDNPGIAENMKNINEAYAVLSNPEKRREYDALSDQFGNGAYTRFRSNFSEQDIFNNADIWKIFEEVSKAYNLRGTEEVFREFYGPGFQGRGRGRPGAFAGGFVFTGFPGAGKRGHGTGNPMSGANTQQRLGRFSRAILEKMAGVKLPENGRDITERIFLTPVQAVAGGPFAYEYRKQAKKLVVHIPAGVREGQKIRLAGMGDAGKNGGPAGDLYLRVHVQKPVMERIKGFVGGLLKGK